MYTETSGGQYHKTFDLTKNVAAGDTVTSLTFQYNMYGSAMGTAELQIFDGTSWSTVWSKSGQQGSGWRQASVATNSGSTSKLAFIYTSGSSWAGDFAIDKIEETYAVPVVPSPAPTFTPISPYIFQDSFETGMDGWLTGPAQVLTDTPPFPPDTDCGDTACTGGDLPFIRNSGGDPNARRKLYGSVDWDGPNAAADGNWYVYAETSSPNYPNKDFVMEKELAPDDNIWMVSFKYWMDVSSTHRAHFYTSADGIYWITQWWKMGNKGSGWHQANVPLKAEHRNAKFLRIEYSGGATWSGDFAIDDVWAWDDLGQTPSPTPDAVLTIGDFDTIDWDGMQLIGRCEILDPNCDAGDQGCIDNGQFTWQKRDTPNLKHHMVQYRPPPLRFENISNDVGLEIHAMVTSVAIKCPASGCVDAVNFTLREPKRLTSTTDNSNLGIDLFGEWGDVYNKWDLMRGRVNGATGDRIPLWILAASGRGEDYYLSLPPADYGYVMRLDTCFSAAPAGTSWLEQNGVTVDYSGAFGLVKWVSPKYGILNSLKGTAVAGQLRITAGINMVRCFSKKFPLLTRAQGTGMLRMNGVITGTLNGYYDDVKQEGRLDGIIETHNLFTEIWAWGSTTMSDDEESYFGDIDTNGKCWDNDYNSQANPTLSVMSNLKLEASLENIRFGDDGASEDKEDRGGVKATMTLSGTMTFTVAGQDIDYDIEEWVIVDNKDVGKIDNPVQTAA